VCAREHGSSLIVLLAAPLPPAIGETIQLERSQHGTYTISVQINGALVLPFVLDTGASLEVIPADVFRTLVRTGTVTRNDFVGSGAAVLADGSKHASDKYVLHEARVGNHIVRDVVASVVSINGDPLLGQTFLSKLPPWTIDNSRQVLVIDESGVGPELAGRAHCSVGVGLLRCCRLGSGHRQTWLEFDQATAQFADEAALGECGATGCKVIMRAGPAMCVALVTNENGRYVGAASRRYSATARLAALTNCQKSDAGSCVVRMSGCRGRAPVKLAQALSVWGDGHPDNGHFHRKCPCPSGVPVRLALAGQFGHVRAMSVSGFYVRSAVSGPSSSTTQTRSSALPTRPAAMSNSTARL
jgi:hypothetical protein